MEKAAARDAMAVTRRVRRRRVAPAARCVWRVMSSPVGEARIFQPSEEFCLPGLLGTRGAGHRDKGPKPQFPRTPRVTRSANRRWAGSRLAVPRRRFGAEPVSDRCARVQDPTLTGTLVVPLSVCIGESGAVGWIAPAPITSGALDVHDLDTALAGSIGLQRQSPTGRAKSGAFSTTRDVGRRD